MSEEVNNEKIIQCPHCNHYIIMIKLNCGIFRHGILKTDYKQIDSHCPKEQCDKYIENNDYLLKTKYKINNKTGIKIFSENIIYLLIFNKLTNSCFEKIKKYFKLIIINIIYIPDIKPIFENKFHIHEL